MVCSHNPPTTLRLYFASQSSRSSTSHMLLTSLICSLAILGCCNRLLFCILNLLITHVFWCYGYLSDSHSPWLWSRYLSQSFSFWINIGCYSSIVIPPCSFHKSMFIAYFNFLFYIHIWLYNFDSFEQFISHLIHSN